MNDTNTPDVIIRGKAIKFHPFDPKLGTAFDFSEEDLELNHKGKLSQPQKKRLIVKRDRLIAMWASGGVFLLLLLFGFVPQIYPDISQAHTGVQIIFGVLPIWMLIAAFTIGRNRSREIEGELVAIIAGELIFIISGKNAKHANMMRIGHLEWVINPQQYHLLSNHKHGTTTNMAVYYVAHSDELLSVVQVDLLNENIEETPKNKQKAKKNLDIFARIYQKWMSMFS